MTTAALPTARFARRPGLALLIGLAGLVLTGLGFVLDPRQAFASWLAAFAAGLSTVLGALILVAITHLTGARWFDPFRRLALDLVASLPLFALLFLVLVPGLGRVYPWVLAPSPTNSAYLNEPFFLARAAIYFTIWIGVGLLLRRWALAARSDARHPPSTRERLLAAVSLPALGLSLTFAAFDWVMSLAPGWVSTVFGVYWFAGGILAALAAMALSTKLLASRARDGSVGPALAENQLYALGALMLTFIVFWGYIAYSQYFVIWIADVPAEVAWYLPRVHGGWGALALVLIGGHLVVPFFILLFHAAKVNHRVLAVLAGWLLVMHYLDSYWMVLPHFHPAGPAPHWLDLAAALAVGGTVTAWSGWQHRR